MNKAAAKTLIDTEFERLQGRMDAICSIGDAILDFETSVVAEADKRPLDEKRGLGLYRWPGAKNIGE